MENQNKLKAKLSNFETPLTYNEWVKKFNVSRDYVVPTKYYQGNSNNGYYEAKETKLKSLDIIRRNIISLFK
jgi:hypothetical protein